MTMLMFENEREDSLDIREVVIASEKLTPDEFRSLLTCRAGLGEPLGSHYKHMTPQEVREALVRARWRKTKHPRVKGKYKIYVTADMKNGFYGLAKLFDLAMLLVRLEDRRNTGYLVPVVYGTVAGPAEQSMLITEILHGEEVIRTFFPGGPTEHPKVKTTSELLGKEIRAEEALKLGFTYAMIDERDHADTREQ